MPGVGWCNSQEPRPLNTSALPTSSLPGCQGGEAQGSMGEGREIARLETENPPATHCALRAPKLETFQHEDVAAGIPDPAEGRPNQVKPVENSVQPQLPTAGETDSPHPSCLAEGGPAARC